MEPAQKRTLIFSIEFAFTALMFFLPWGAEQMGLPRNFWLGLGAWIVGAAIAIHIFWVFPVGVSRLSNLEKALIAFIAVGLFALFTFKSVSKAYEAQYPISKPPDSPSAELKKEPPVQPQTPIEEKSKKPTSHSEKQAPPSTTINAPNGIGISGGTVSNPTVNNNYGALPDQPEPGDRMPTVTICSTIAGDAGKYVTTIKIQTDSPITRPSYGFLFDGLVGGGDIAITGLSTTPYVNNLSLLHYENISYAFKLISTDFPAGGDVWNPGVILKATIPSATKVKLQQIFSWFGKDQKPLTEHRVFPCDSPLVN